MDKWAFLKNEKQKQKWIVRNSQISYVFGGPEKQDSGSRVQGQFLKPQGGETPHC